MTIHRCFHAADLAIGKIVLSPEESHHLLRVRRAQMQDAVEIIDGKGGRARARLEKTSSGRAHLVIEHVLHEESLPELRVAVPLPRGGRAEWLIEKLSETSTPSLATASLIAAAAERGRTIGSVAFSVDARKSPEPTETIESR